MRKWGVVISGLYALMVMVVLYPAGMLLAGAGTKRSPEQFLQTAREGLADGFIWTFAITLVASQALLLFLSVDTSQKRLKPRTHIWLTCAVAGALTALLVSGVVFSVGVGISGDKFIDRTDVLIHTVARALLMLGVLWVLWGIVFYLYFRNKSSVVSRVISWLLKGSVLELLVAVPCHVLVRQRHECCAPIVTSFGIVTGIAIMLVSFGPSVLFLYKKRLDGYAVKVKG